MGGGFKDLFLKHCGGYIISPKKGGEVFRSTTKKKTKPQKGNSEKKN